MSRYVQPDANPSSATLTAAAVTQLGGYVQGNVNLTIQNNDGSVTIAVLVWMGADPPDAATVAAGGIQLAPGGSMSPTVTVGGTGLAARNVRPRYYAVSLNGDQSGAYTQVSEART